MGPEIRNLLLAYIKQNSKISDLYARLGIAENSSQKEIEDAFKMWTNIILKIEGRPNPNNPAYQSFHEAYYVLSNPEMHAAYDKKNYSQLELLTRETKGVQIIWQVFDLFKVHYEPYLTPEHVRRIAEAEIKER